MEIVREISMKIVVLYTASAISNSCLLVCFIYVVTCFCSSLLHIPRNDSLSNDSTVIFYAIDLLYLLHTFYIR